MNYLQHKRYAVMILIICIYSSFLVLEVGSGGEGTL